MQDGNYEMGAEPVCDPGCDSGYKRLQIAEKEASINRSGEKVSTYLLFAQIAQDNEELWER